MSTSKPMTQEQLDAIRGTAEVVTTLRTASFNDWQELALNLSECVDDLLAEVKRLRALTTVDDAMMERATRAFGAATAQVSSVPLGMSGDTFMDSVGLQHLHAIRAALDAALGTKECA